MYIHTSEVIQVEQNVHNCNANRNRTKASTRCIDTVQVRYNSVLKMTCGFLDEINESVFTLVQNLTVSVKT
jgi:hypothetical protein